MGQSSDRSWRLDCENSLQLRKSSVALTLVSILASMLFSSCSSSLDIYRVATDELQSQELAISPSHAAPIQKLWLRIASDQRSLSERGLRRPGGTSYVGSSRLREPLEVSLLRILANQAVQRGFSQSAVFREDPTAHTLQVTIRELSASFSEGVENLAVILPTSRIEAKVDCELGLLDPVGRKLGILQIKGSREVIVPPIQDAEESAGVTLAEILAEEIARIWPQLEALKVAVAPDQSRGLISPHRPE